MMRESAREREILLLALKKQVPSYDLIHGESCIVGDCGHPLGPEDGFQPVAKKQPGLSVTSHKEMNFINQNEPEINSFPVKPSNVNKDLLTP